MAGAWLWVRREWRRHGAGLVGLSLLIAVVAGVTLAVAGGAERTASAFERFQKATNAFQIGVDLRQPETQGSLDIAAVPTAEELAERVSAVDGVRGVRVATFVGASPDPSSPNLFSIVPTAARGQAPTARLLEGRYPDDNAADEIVVNEAAAEEWGLDLGSETELTTLAPDQFGAFIQSSFEEPRGPKVPVRVVGMIRDIEDISDFPEAFFLAGPGFLDRWGDEVINVTGIASVYADPDRVDAVIERLNATVGPMFEATRASDLDDFANRVDRTIDVEVTMLRIFTVAAALAGLVVVAQALVRSAAASTTEQATLHALGMDRRHQVLASVLRVTPALVAGAALALPLAYLLSPVFPRGLAHRAEPDPGLRAEPAVLVGGVTIVVIVLLVLAVLTSWRAARMGTAPPARASRRAGPLARFVAAVPIVPALGTQFALERDRRRGIAGGMAGIVGSAVLVGGLVGVATVERSRDRLLTDSRLYGADWDFQMQYYGLDDPEATMAELAADPDVAAVGTRSQLAADDGLLQVSSEGERASAEPVAYDWIKGSRGPVVSTGRPPGSGETAIGRELARRLGVTIGDTIVVDAATRELPLRVTGWLVHPGNDDLDRGLVVTPDTLDAMRRQDCPEDSEESVCFLDVEGIAVAVDDRADQDSVQARLAARYPTLEVIHPPSIVDNLRQVGSTPWVLAAFLAIIGAAGLAHALIVGVRRHEHDVAVVRTLGLRPVQARSVVRWQAMVMATLGAALGLAIGLLAGRIIWQRVVDGVGALVSVGVPLVAMVAAPALAIGLALLLSSVSGRRAAHLHPALVLRAE